jgi:hypothetical protein
MLAIIVITIIAALFSSTIDWVAIVWMAISAMWVVVARMNELISDGWEELYRNTVDNRRRVNVEDLAKPRGKQPALDNDYQKITKHNEEISKENAQHQERVVDISGRYNDTVAKHEATSQQIEMATQTLYELTKVPSTRLRKKEYTEQDRARIREEMKTVGVKPEAKSPVEGEG